MLSCSALLSRSGLYIRGTIGQRVPWARQDRRWLKELASRKQVQEELKCYLQSRRDGSLEGNESILINCIKSCATGLHSVRAQRRVSLADDIIGSLKKYGLPLSVKIQNSLLQVYINNHHVFSPSAFLENMKEENISPNGETLFLLLHAYCQQGNMEGAKEILQEIQANGIPINEDIYASLITCHAMLNEMKEARKMLQDMRDNGLEPKGTAYSALLSGYAYHGDLESVKETIQMMKSQQVYAGHSMYIDMIDALSRGGHSDDKMNALLDMIRKKQWMYAELIDKVQVIAGRGDLPGTVSLLECLCGLKSKDDSTEHMMSAARMSFSMLSFCDQPLSSLLSSMSVFHKAEVPSKFCYEVMIKKAINEKEWNNLKLILKDMAANGVAIKGIYVYPPLANISQEKRVEDLMEWLSLCKSYNVTVDKPIVDFCYMTFGHDMTLLLKQLSERDLLSYVLPSALNFVCMLGHEERAQTFCQYLRDQRENIPAVSSLIEAIRLGIPITFRPKVTLYFDVIKTLSVLCKTDEEISALSDAVFRTISSVVHGNPGKDTVSFLESLLSDEKTAGLVEPKALRLTMSILSKRKFVTEFHQLLKLFSSCGRQLDCDHHRAVVNIAVKEGDADLALSSFKAMKQQGCYLQANIFSKIIEVSVKDKRHGTALSVYGEMKRLKIQPRSLKVSTILIDSLLSVGKLSEALSIRRDIQKGETVPTLEMFNAFIGAYGQRGDVDKSNQEFQSLKALGLKPSLTTYEMLMKGYSYHGDVTRAKEIVEESIASGLGTSRNMVSSLLETYMNMDDLEGAVSYLESLDDIRPTLPICIQLVNECEMNRRRDLTEKTLAVIPSFGKDQEEIDCIFVFALLRAGQSTEALEFSKEKNLKASTVKNSANIFSKAGNVQDIRLGIQLLDRLGLPSLSLYKSLIEAHAHNNDRESILAVKSELEANELKKPDDSFYTLLDKLLCDLAGRA